MWAASDMIGSVTATVRFTEEMLAIKQTLFLDLGEKNPPVLQFKVVPKRFLFSFSFFARQTSTF